MLWLAPAKSSRAAEKERLADSRQTSTIKQGGGPVAVLEFGRVDAEHPIVFRVTKKQPADQRNDTAQVKHVESPQDTIRWDGNLQECKSPARFKNAFNFRNQPVRLLFVKRLQSER